MKICFIVGSFPNMKCGVGDYTKILAEELALKGNEISVITSKNANREECGNLQVFNIVNSWSFDEKEIIIKALNDIKPDIVHIQYPSEKYGKSLFINLLPRIIKKEVKCKVVETVHEYFNYTIKGKMRNLINYSYADKIIVVEEQYIDKIKEFIPFKSNKLDIKYIPISSNIPKSNITKQDIEKIKSSLQIGKSMVLSYFGFVNELKGVDTLIKSVSELIKKGYDIKLMILSELSYDIIYQREILDMINRLGIASNVIITGFIDSSDEVADYLSISNLCILPFVDGVSQRNGSFLAAYNQGIPIVTTSNTTTDFKGVYYVKPNDVDGIVEKVIVSLEKDMNKKFDRDILTWDEVVNAHLEIYK